MHNTNNQPYYASNPSVEELVRRYNSGERYFHEIDLPERSDLGNTSFADATFDYGFLSDVDFRGANLRNVKFLNCNVKVTDFRGADLEGADFRGSSLEATYFQNANLTNTSFAGAYCYGYELKVDDGPDAQGRF
jgi:uncharacterized protein YjbI with pentapeptide repeats